MIGRGLEQRNIFSQDADKTDFLRRFGVSLEKVDATCLAWALMSNHYHLLIRVGSRPLSALMASVLTGYATNYNRRHQRSGYVFQNRFKSILCDKDEYLLRLIQYIHLNPWKAGIVSDLDALDLYPWTGHAGLLGEHIQPWHATNSVLSLFSDKRQPARHAYRELISRGMRDPNPINLSGGGLVRSAGGWDRLQKIRKEHEIRIGDERILGDSCFVEAVLAEDSIGLNHQASRELKDWNLSKLSVAICQYHGVDEARLAFSGRKNNRSKVRLIIAYLAKTELGCRSLEIENHLNISQSAVSKLVRKGCEICHEENISLSKYLNH